MPTLPRRGLSVIEVLIASTILGLLLTMVMVEFSLAFSHNALTSEKLTNEQQARHAMALLTNSLSLAATDNTDACLTCAPLPAIQDVSATSVTFYRVHNMNPKAMKTDPYGSPQPDYWVHIVSWDFPTKTLNEYQMPYKDFGKPSPAPIVLARNIQRFEMTPNTDDVGNVTSINVSLEVFGANALRKFGLAGTVKVLR